MRGRRSYRPVDRGLEELVVELAGYAERHREIEMPNPKAVDAIDCGNRISVVDPLRSLYLAEERAALVGRKKFVGNGARAVAIMGDLERHAAPAFRVILHGVDYRARLLRGPDHRKHDALRSHIHGTGNVVVLP
jgi:hypothetical protein